jgi:acetyl/propionyl-CoA carboxylase alpha subunit
MERLMAQKIRVLHGGREVEIVAEKLQGRLWYHMDGETYVFEPESEKRSSKSHSANPNVVEAPMPGKVLRVEVKPGESVKAGHTLIVMEAMKMEYTLAASHNATVEEVGCKPGEQVKLGQLLVRLKD